MNGEEKKYLEIELAMLKTQFNERWDAHDKGAKERMRNYCSKFDDIKEFLKEIFGRLNSLPCNTNVTNIESLRNELTSIKVNDLKHLNIKLNALLFTVLGGVFISLIIMGIKMLLPANGGG